MKPSLSRRFFINAFVYVSAASFFKLSAKSGLEKKLTLKRSFILKPGQNTNITEFDNYIFQYLDKDKILQFNTRLYQNGSISSFKRMDESDRVVFHIQFKNTQALDAYNKNLSFLLKDRSEFLSGPYYIENTII